MSGSTPGAAVAAGQQQAGVWCSAPVLCLCVVFGPLLGLRVLFMACFVRWWWRSVASLVNWWWWWWYAVRCQIGLALALALALTPVLCLCVMFGCVVPLCGVQGLFCAFARFGTALCICVVWRACFCVVVGACFVLLCDMAFCVMCFCLGHGSCPRGAWDMAHVWGQCPREHSDRR